MNFKINHTNTEKKLQILVLFQYNVSKHLRIWNNHLKFWLSSSIFLPKISSIRNIFYTCTKYVLATVKLYFDTCNITEYITNIIIIVIIIIFCDATEATKMTNYIKAQICHAFVIITWHRYNCHISGNY